MSEDQFTKLVNSMEYFRTELKDSMQDFRTEIKDSMQDFKIQVKGSMDDFRTEMNARFDKNASEDQLKKLFKYTSEHFSDTEKKLDETASRDSLDRLQNTIDNFVGRLDNAEVEQTSRDLQFNRLLDWARKVSKKTGIPLVDL